MAKVTVRRRTDNVRADGKAPIYAVLYIDKNKIRIPLEIAVSDDEWDPLGERVKGLQSYLQSYRRPGDRRRTQK